MQGRLLAAAQACGIETGLPEVAESSLLCLQVASVSFTDPTTKAERLCLARLNLTPEGLPQLAGIWELQPGPVPDEASPAAPEGPSVPLEGSPEAGTLTLDPIVEVCLPSTPQRVFRYQCCLLVVVSM